MKRCMQFLLLLSVFGLSLFYGPPDARAHGTDYSLVEGEALTAVAFNYSDGEPMAYAEVLVFSPQDPKVEHQNGRTDKHGKFAFCPDMSGTWRITANDGMGHLCQATVEVGQGDATGKADRPRHETAVASTVEGTKTLKIIAGLSLIGNLGFASWFFSRKSRASKGKS
jgi:nickel transport protein